MPAFDRDTSEYAYVPLDYRLLQNGSLVEFHDPSVLALTCEWLRRRGYYVHEIDASEALDATALRQRLTASIQGWPDYAHARNWDSLADGLRDIAFPAHGGVAFVIHSFDGFAGQHPKDAKLFMAVLDRTARFHLLFGDRCMTLFQVSDREFRLGPVGELSAHVNFAEWGAKGADVERAIAVIKDHFRPGE